MHNASSRRSSNNAVNAILILPRVYSVPHWMLSWSSSSKGRASMELRKKRLIAGPTQRTKQKNSTFMSGSRIGSTFMSNERLGLQDFGSRWVSLFATIVVSSGLSPLLSSTLTPVDRARRIRV